MRHGLQRAGSFPAYLALVWLPQAEAWPYGSELDTKVFAFFPPIWLVDISGTTALRRVRSSTQQTCATPKFLRFFFCGGKRSKRLHFEQATRFGRFPEWPRKNMEWPDCRGKDREMKNHRLICTMFPRVRYSRWAKVVFIYCCIAGIMSCCSGFALALQLVPSLLRTMK